MNKFLPFFTPNAHVGKTGSAGATAFWIVLVVFLWMFVDIHFLPKPGQILEGFSTINQQGVFDPSEKGDLRSSLITMIEAIFWSCVISLPFAYASVIPIVAPVAKFISGLRYLGLVGLMLVFTLMAPTGQALKVMVLTFGITVFYLRDVISIVEAIPQEQYDHAKTLGMGPFRTLYEVVACGTLDEALESLRVNAAMGWMMLTMVEGVTRTGGGIGVILLNNQRHMDLPAVGAMLVTLFCLGIGQDYLLGALRNLLCPYAKLGRS
jgi:NitT/TauT family transport system permease protein